MFEFLWPSFVSPELGLDKSQRTQIHRQAWRLWWRDRRNLLLYGAAIGIYLLAAFLVVKPAAEWVGLSLQLPSFTIKLLRAGASVLLPIAYFVLLGAVLQRWRFAPCVYRALRQEGHDVCGRCGYLLRGLPADGTCCPECGAKRLESPG
ncbi:MAG: hypothetical protein ACF8NJ_00730 [Phycisphaerales bacterium JB038]